MHPYPPCLLERAHVEVDMEGLKKDQNPLVLAVTARLYLEEKYQHHLKIFTDGSVMEDGAAGAAFVIPEFNNLTHSYSLPAVSVFTAELLAISMALQLTSAIPVTPFAIVICSDSKAALTSIKSGSQNAREDLVREIRQLPTSWSPAVRKFAFSGYQRTSASLETRRRIEQQKEEPRELTPWQWRWKSAWPTYMPN